MRDSLRPRNLYLVAVLVLVYFVLGYTVVPAFLVPFGCTGILGDEAVQYAPSASFNITYDDQAGSLTVRHTGGSTLPADRTDELLIRLTTSNDRTNYTWAEAGGSFPVRDGDSLTLSDVSLRDGDVVRIEWIGSWPDPQPNYCPNDHPTAGSVTLAKRAF